MKKINKLLFAFMFIAMFTGLCFGIVANKNNQEINISTPLQQQNSETLSANLSASSETQTSTENITVTYGEKVTLTATVAVSDTNISNESYVWQKKSGESWSTLDNTTQSITLFNVADSGEYQTIITYYKNGEQVSETTQPVIVTINKAPLTIKASDASMVFGTRKQIQPTITTENIAFSDSVSALTGCSLNAFNYNGVDLSYGSHEDVVYALKVSIFNSNSKTSEQITWGTEESDNYNITWIKGTLTVTPLEISDITVSDLSKIYGDEDPLVTKAITIGQNGVTQQIILTLKISKRNIGEHVSELGYLISDFEIVSAKSTNGINYSTNNFTVNYTNTNDTKLIIEKRELIIDSVTAINREFDGTFDVELEIKFSNVANQDIESLDVCVEYAKVDDFNASSELKNVSYALQPCGSENAINNYEINSLPTVTVQITPKVLNIVWLDAETLSYNGENQKPTATTDNTVIIDDEVQQPQIIVSVEAPYTENHNKVNTTYTAVATLSETETNYVLNEDTISIQYQINEFVLNKSDIMSLIEIESEIYIYDGKTHSLEISKNDAIDYVEFVSFENNEIKDFGTKEVVANFKAKEGYIFNDQTYTLELYRSLSVDAKQLEIIWEDYSDLVYNGENQKPIARVETGVLLENSSTEYETLPIEVTVVEPYTTSHANAGEYIAQADLVNENLNYYINNLYIPITYQIKPAVITIDSVKSAVSFENKTHTYDGSIYMIEYQTVGTIPEYVIFNGYLNNSLQDAGQIKAIARFITDDNHIFDNGNYFFDLEATLTINKKEATIVWSNYQNLLYNGENQKPSATVSGAIQLPSGSYETIDITVSVKAPYQTNHSQAGNYTAVASTNNTNYQLLNTTLDYQIKQTSININENDKNIITIDCPEGLDANISISYNDITNEIDVENIDVSHILENGTIDKVIKLAFNQRSEIQSESLGTNLIVKINLNEISSFSNIKIARLYNNHLEYISSTIEDNCLVFNTTQLGDFAIITTEPNVWWPWLLLGIGGIVIILIVSCTLIYLRKSATFILDEKPIYIATGFKGKKIKVPENLKKYQWYKDKNLKVISTLVMQNENIDLFAKTIEPKEEIKINSDAEYLKEVEQPKVKKAKTQTTSKTVKKESTSSKNTKAKNTSKIAQTKTKKEDIGNTEIKATPKNDNKNKSTAKSKTDTSKLKNGTTNKSNSTVKKTSTTKEKTSTSKTQKKTVDGKITRTKSK